jgi:hypothetical protein
MFNVLYKGRKIFQNLSYEECTEVLENLSEKFYESGEYDPEQIELEEI